MYRKIVSSLHTLNIVFQAIYSLALPIGLGALASYLLTKHLNAPGWIWAVLMLLGVFTGLYSMVKFILTASKNLKLLEQAAEQAAIDARREEERRARLRGEITDDENIYKEKDNEK